MFKRKLKIITGKLRSLNTYQLITINLLSPMMSKDNTDWEHNYKRQLFPIKVSDNINPRFPAVNQQLDTGICSRKNMAVHLARSQNIRISSNVFGNNKNLLMYNQNA